MTSWRFILDGLRHFWRIHLAVGLGIAVATAVLTGALLVGDSVNQVLAGAETTLSATLEQMIYHTRIVCRGARQAMVVCDLPFLTFQVSREEAVRNAGRVLAETGCHAVKLEGGQPMAATVRALVDVGTIETATSRPTYGLAPKASKLAADWSDSTMPVNIPVRTTMGEESMRAVRSPVTVFVAPGPEVTSATPGRPVERA